MNDKNLDFDPMDRNTETLEDILSELPYSFEIVDNRSDSSLYLINGKKKILAGTVPDEYLPKLADGIIEAYRGNSRFFRTIEIYDSWRVFFDKLDGK